MRFTQPVYVGRVAGDGGGGVAIPFFVFSMPIKSV